MEIVNGKTNAKIQQCDFAKDVAGRCVGDGDPPGNSVDKVAPGNGDAEAAGIAIGTADDLLLGASLPIEGAVNALGARVIGATAGLLVRGVTGIPLIMTGAAVNALGAMVTSTTAGLLVRGVAGALLLGTGGAVKAIGVQVLRAAGSLV